MKNTKQHFIITILMTIFITHATTKAMENRHACLTKKTEKKLAGLVTLVGAATLIGYAANPDHASKPLPYPPILDHSSEIYGNYLNALETKDLVTEYELSDLNEKTLCDANDVLYRNYQYNRYLIVHSIIQYLNGKIPTFTKNLQTLFDHVCCNRPLLDSIEKSIECCQRAPLCTPPYNCSDVTHWPDAVSTCEILRNHFHYPCKTTLPLIIDQSMTQPRNRFNQTSLINYTRDNNPQTVLYPIDYPITLTKTVHHRAQHEDNNASYNISTLYRLLQEALRLNTTKQSFEAGENEKSLALAPNSNYIALHKQYIKNNFAFMASYYDFLRTHYYPFQKDIQNIQDSTCCDPIVLEHVKKLINCCSNPTCSPTVNCSSLNDWKDTLSLCETLEQFECNTTIPHIIQGILQPKRRFSNAVPLEINDSDDTNN